MDVSAFPLGYLDLLQSQDRGRGVSQAADALAPVINIEEMLLVQRREFIAVAGIGISNISAFILRVPAAEIWRVRRGHARWASDAGGAITEGLLLISCQQPGWAGQRLLVTDPVNTTASVARWQRFPEDGICGVWLPPGTELYGFATAITGTAANNSVDVSLWYESLRV